MGKSPTSPNLSEKSIQVHLWKHLDLKKYQIVVPNYTPAGWFECDMFGVTRAGIGIEYEIKISSSDLRADQKKSAVFTKHDMLAGKTPLRGPSRHAPYESGPSRFYYVVSDNVATDGIPDWAGLIVVHVVAGKIRLVEVKPAALRHSVKVPQAVIDHMRRVCYWRFWNLRVKTYLTE